MVALIRRLCAAVEVYADESLLSVIARSAHANALPDTASLLRHAQIKGSRTAWVPFTQRAAAERIGVLLNMSEEEVGRRMSDASERSSRDG